MSKSVTATLPAVLLVLFWWQRGRLEWKRDVLPLVPWFAVGASAGLFTAWVESAPGLIGAQGPQYSLTFVQRVLVAGRVPWFYAEKAVFPRNLMFTYPHWKIDSGDPLQYLFPVALVALAAGLGWLARTNRAPLAAFLVFMGTLFPALGFLNVFPFRYSYVADHFQYLALLGIIVPCAVGITVVIRRNRVAAIAVPVLLTATLGAATYHQSGNYRDYETLFRATLAHNDGSSFVHSNLGVILMSSGREAEAAGHFETAVRLTPDDPSYRVNLGLALAQLPGRLPDAIAEYRKALQLDPDLPTAHVNLGLALSTMPGRLPDAIAEYRKAIAEYSTTRKGEPELWQSHYNLALAWAQTEGRGNDAIEEFRAALKLKPESAIAHSQFGNTLQKMGRLEDAVTEYRASLQLDPEVPEVHYEMAYALAQIPGHVPEAIVECRKMLALRPGDRPGQELLASLLKFSEGNSR
jgi:tetratricopeptide (TPR) repeat protein